MSTKVKVYNLEGKNTGEIELPSVFESEPNDYLLAQYVRVYLANQRQGTRDTKDRSEVNGKSRKPYKQKGTGNARHGSRKAPSWKGGGVAHGPKPQNFSLKMSKTQRFLALISAYAKKKEECVVLENAEFSDVKTKNVVNFLDTVKLNSSVLFVTTDVQKNLVLSSRNLQNVQIVTAATVNAYDVMKYNNIVIEKSVLDLMTDTSEESAENTEALTKKKSK